MKCCKNICVAIFGLLLSSCASTGSGYSYNEVVVLNQSRVAVGNVLISSTASGRVFSCGNIAPRGICSNKFPPQPYLGKPIRIEWVVGSGQRRSKTVELELPTGIDSELPMRGVLVIDGQGGIDAYLQQEVPGPRR
ncbi:hypothetical protein N8198_10595 [Gammaproteobacteria bacterium]|nr:hypothetical protein [Gammaproteobacteria bacterium]